MEHLTAEAFKEKICDYTGEKRWKFKGELPAIIDFYSDWCPPCKMVAPLLEQLAQEYAGQVDIYKVNTDDQQELAGVFGIQSIPSILFIPKQGEPRMSVGALPKEAFKEIISEVLGVG